MTIIDKRIICADCGKVLQKGDGRYLRNGKLYCERCQFKHPEVKKWEGGGIIRRW